MRCLQPIKMAFGDVDDGEVGWDGVDDEMRSRERRFAVPADLFEHWGPEVRGGGGGARM